MGGWGLNRERGERRCDGRSKCWLHEHDKKTKSRVVHVIILCYMPCAKEFTTRGAKNCFKPPPICLCSKREDAGGVDHLLLLEQVHAVWAKKPETSAGVPIKRCEFYQPSHNTASYLQLQFLHTSVDRSQPIASLWHQHALYVSLRVSHTTNGLRRMIKIFGETIFSHSASVLKTIRFCDPAKNFSFYLT